MRIGSLFAGIGGFDLAARWMGWETAWFSEVDPYASAVLAKHWPGVPNHGDITTIDFTAVEPVDMLCGGFPCQDISSSGKKAGLAGERSGLWRHYARAIGELRPRYAVMENVTDLLTRGLGAVLGDVAALGYDAEWHCIPACAVGAPQRRDRAWIVAHHDGGRREGRSQRDGAGPQLVGRLDPDGLALAQRRAGDAASRIRRVDHGVSRWVDRLACLGNAIVPQCALVIFQAIEAREHAMKDAA